MPEAGEAGEAGEAAEAGGSVVRRQARAKVNVFLRVVGVRPDGYHDLESLVVPVSLADTVTVRASARLHVTMDVAPGIAFEEVDPRQNLARRAAEEWIRARGTADESADVHVDKRIPVAAGLGGGSADAAAVLRAMNDLWGDPFSLDELAEMGAGIGSDVPALLLDAAVVMEGRGETVKQIDVPTTWWVLVPQAFPVPTPEAYRWWDDDGARTGPDPAPLVEAARVGDVEALARGMFNDLAEPVLRRHPGLHSLREGLLDAGALGVILCGSGPTMAGLARDEEHANRIAARFPSAIAVSGPG